MSFYERYEKCCKELKILPKSQFAAESLGCTRSYIIALSKSGNTPNGDIVSNASKMLNVSSDYLLELINEPRPIVFDYDREELKFVSKYRELNIEGKVAANSMISGLVDNDIYKKCNSAFKKINKK